MFATVFFVWQTQKAAIPLDWYGLWAIIIFPMRVVDRSGNSFTTILVIMGFNGLNQYDVGFFRFFRSSPSSSPPSSTLLLLRLLYLTYLSPYSVMSVSKPSSSRAPEFRDPLSFPVLPYVREYANYLDAVWFTDMRTSNLALTVCDLHSMVCNTDAGACVKLWLPCGEHSMSVLRDVAWEVDCTFVRCYEEVEYEKDFSSLLKRYDGQSLPETDPPRIVLRSTFSHFYFDDCFHYLAFDCNFGLRLRLHAREIFAGCIGSNYFLFPCRIS